MNGEIKILKHYLTRFHRSKINRYILTDRLAAVREKLKDEEFARQIEDQIRDQDREADRAMSEVVEIAALLPPDSYERVIIELRHIDEKSWKAIQKTLHLTASPCYEHYKRGLEALLENQGIRERLGLKPLENSTE